MKDRPRKSRSHRRQRSGDERNNALTDAQNIKSTT